MCAAVYCNETTVCMAKRHCDINGRSLFCMSIPGGYVLVF